MDRGLFSLGLQLIFLLHTDTSISTPFALPFIDHIKRISEHSEVELLSLVGGAIGEL